jgi:serine protease Do
MSDQDSKSSVTQTESEVNKTTMMKPKSTKIFRQLILPFITGVVGIVLGLALAVLILPQTSLFPSSPLGQYIEERSSQAALEVSKGVMSDVQKQLAAVEEQKEIIEDARQVPNMTVSEIVEQNKTSVVTIVTSIADPELAGETRRFIGTGFILNREGMIATNQHVVGGAETITVILSDGRELKGQEINSDRDTDLAIIKIDDRNMLPGIVTMGNSNDINVGEQVVAIGSPVSRNFAGTVTSGIISGKDRNVYIGDSVINYLQTDAAINEGNSGGPLFNAKGEVIGINTAKMSDDVQGIGFAIPINILQEKLAFLSKVPVYTGFTAKDLSPEAMEALNISNGIVVIAVDQGSPADEAGIEEKDIILKFDGEEILKTTEMTELRERHEVGDLIKMEVKRGNDIFQVELEISERP